VKMQSIKLMFSGRCLKDVIKLRMLGEHKGENFDMVWLNFSPFRSSIGPSPFSLKRWWYRNVLFTTNVIAKDVEFGMWKTFSTTTWFSHYKKPGFSQPINLQLLATICHLQLMLVIYRTIFWIWSLQLCSN
jgi:hypothetical protein